METSTDSNTLPFETGDHLPQMNWLSFLEESRASLRGLVASKLRGQGEEAIEDVLQEVAIATQSVKRQPIEPSKAGAWLRQVAIHKVQDYWRKVGQQNRLRTRYAADHEPQRLDSPYEWILRVEQSEAVTDAMQRLDEEDRVLLEQKYYHGRSYDEIASGLGISIKALEYRLARARQEMRRRIDLSLTHNHRSYE